jgi:PD-(D/E)XK nuclease superfamily
LPVLSVNRKLKEIIAIPSGNQNSNDKKYEDTVCQILATLFYPKLDFAEAQSRTDSGVLIRDLIFYNNRSYDFLKDIFDLYSCRQVVVELKNVREVEREHINQLNRYLNNQFGDFGIIFTRNKPPKNIYKNTLDLWA